MGQEARDLIRTSPAKTRWAIKAGEGDTAARRRLRDAGISEDVEKAIRDELAEKENTNGKSKENQHAEGTDSEKKVEEPARTASEKQNETAEEVNQQPVSSNREEDNAEPIRQIKDMVQQYKDGKISGRKARAAIHNIRSDFQSKSLQFDHKTANPVDEAAHQAMSEIQESIKAKEAAISKESMKQAVEKGFTGEDVHPVTISMDRFTALRRMSKAKWLSHVMHFVENLHGEKFTDPMGNEVYFEPDAGESMEAYALHLIAGKNKSLDEARINRVWGVELAQQTIEHPAAIVIQKGNGNKLYLRMYNDGENLSSNIVVEVEKGKDGRIATCMLTGHSKQHKRAAINDFLGHLNGSKEILYLDKDMGRRPSGHSRLHAGNETSQVNANLHLSGNSNVAQNGPEGKVQKSEKTEFGFTKDPYIALDALLRATGGKWKSNAKSIPVKKQTPPAVKGKKKEIDTDLPEKDVHPKVDSTESIDPSTINTGGMTDADIDAEIER